MQKIRTAMASSGKFLLTRMVEVDETYIGGHREGPRGRGAKDKTLVAIAVGMAPQWVELISKPLIRSP